jgi:hypothetical protein
MSMLKKAVSLLLSAVLLAMTALLAATYLERRSLPYNEIGRYFDPAYSVVYEQQAVAVYGILAAIFAVATAIVVWITLRLRPRPSRTKGPK